MFDRVIYIVKSSLHYYPPCMAQILMLHDLGVDVEIWYGSCESGTLATLDSRGIRTHQLIDKRTKRPGKLDSLLNWLAYRAKARQAMRTVQKTNTMLWFGNVESLIPLKGALGGYHYIVTVLELLDDPNNAMKRRLVMGMARKAQAVVACQTTRAYIMRSWWRLDRVPYVIPNMPYALSITKNCVPSTEITKKYLGLLAGKKFVLFQGILQHCDYLTQIAKALIDIGGEYTLVLMGSDERDRTLVGKVQTVYPQTVHIPYIPAPLHLEITSHASIGIVFYRNDSLNRAYCAPNKIYEYAAFGIPMLANDVPGLVDTVGAAGAAECVEMNHTGIITAIQRIVDRYDEYAESAKQFYRITDNLRTMRLICKNEDIK